MSSGRVLRFVLAVALGAGGVIVAWPLIPATVTDFDGAVMIVPAQPGVEAFVQVEYRPNSQTPHPSDGEIAIRLFNPASTDTRWYVLLSGDAQLTNARVETGDNVTPSTERVEGIDLKPPWSTGPINSFQLFRVEGTDRVQLVGTPKRSPLVEAGDVQSLTMPRVLTDQPMQPAEQDGGLLPAEIPTLELFLANSTPPKLDGWGTWEHPVTSGYAEYSGLSESDTLSVERSSPELNRDKWGSLINWNSSVPFGATALLKDSTASAVANTRSAWAFLLFGAALTLVIEGFLYRRDKSPAETQIAPKVDESRVALIDQRISAGAQSSSANKRRVRNGSRRRRRRRRQ